MWSVNHSDKYEPLLVYVTFLCFYLFAVIIIVDDDDDDDDYNDDIVVYVIMILVLCVCVVQCDSWRFQRGTRSVGPALLYRVVRVWRAVAAQPLRGISAQRSGWVYGAA